MPKPLYLNQCWHIASWILTNIIHWNLNQNTKYFIQASASENIVCKMVATSPRVRHHSYLFFLAQYLWHNFHDQTAMISLLENAFQNVMNKMAAILSRPQRVNSLRPSDTIWRHRSMSTLAQVMACCLTASSHYLNQCWLMISEVLRHSPDSNFTENT